MSATWWPRFCLGAAWILGVAVVSMAAVDAGQTGAAPVWRYDLIRSYPHDPEAFTQGLVFRDGFLYESTGRNGRSSLRRVVLETGRVVQRVAVDRRYFAEGLASWGPHLVQLTWDTGALSPAWARLDASAGPDETLRRAIAMLGLDPAGGAANE